MSPYINNNWSDLDYSQDQGWMPMPIDYNDDSLYTSYTPSYDSYEEDEYEDDDCEPELDTRSQEDIDHELYLWLHTPEQQLKSRFIRLIPAVSA